MYCDMEEDKGDYHIVACATVAEELRALGVPEERMTVLEFGLHIHPDELKARLQAELDRLDGEGSGDILLGYGLCSNAVAGLRSESRRVVIPRVDDCIPLFLGSREVHRRRMEEEPGTYYLTKGWVEAQEDTLSEYERIRSRFGEERAIRLARMMFVNYTSIVLINTGNYRIEDYRAFARMMAEVLELEFREVEGSNRLLEKMLAGDWEEEFVVVAPGVPVERAEFESEQGSAGRA